MTRTIIRCNTCGDEAALRGHGMCANCYQYLYRRQVKEARREPPAPALTVQIEQEIARGTPTRDIMARLEIDYGVVKAVRHAMDEAEAS